jgi:hypothetical protein
MRGMEACCGCACDLIALARAQGAGPMPTSINGENVDLTGT